MHSHNFVLCVKHQGRVLRELGEKIYLPFGSEYSLYLKNLDARRAAVRVFIDGVDVVDGRSLVVNGRSFLELERFLKNGNLSKGNRFKFIERNAAVEAGRGVQAEDGLIRIEFEYERVLPPVTWTTTATPSYPRWPQDPHSFDLRGYGTCNTPGPLTNSISSNSAFNCSVQSKGSVADVRLRGAAAPAVESVDYSAEQYSEIREVNQAGITAPGSVSNQQFTTVAPVVTDGVVHVITLQLLGDTGTKPVTAPITVKTRPVCSMCGTTGEVTAKFCKECGTSLELVA